MRASALTVLAALAASTPLLAQAQPSPGRTTADSTSYAPRYVMPNGRQLVVVYVGGAEAMRFPEFVTSMREMKPLLARQAAERHVALSIAGVSLEWEVERGIRDLQAMGAWDEIVVGNNWINAGAQHWVWRADGDPTTPHVAVYERDVTTTASAITFGAERRVARFEGPMQIIEWVRQGAPLPADERR